MKELFNFSLLVFITGIFAFFVKKIPKQPHYQAAKIFLVSGLVLYSLYMIELLGIANFYGAWTQNFLYGFSLSCLLLAMKFGIRNPGLLIINIFSFVFNIPILHQLILIIIGLSGLKIYHIPTVIREKANYRIESEYHSSGMTPGQDIYFVQKKFPFEKRYEVLSIPRQQYLDSITFSEDHNSLQIRYSGQEELAIDTTFNIK
ncbi:hypothetical protein [uncultured Chryseobacterium sp.]|uniref:hypothetical protein n=1 Tax=uncultured Chryseobacterium sp. TaxID=259322 RepID=UPI0025E14846|nr:hypothetical protein [uncultured Chryseobacterium sp.]